MTLSQEDLFKLALNLQDPWYIKSIEFSSAKKQIDIHIDFIPGSRFEGRDLVIGCYKYTNIPNSTWGVAIGKKRAETTILRHSMPK